MRIKIWIIVAYLIFVLRQILADDKDGVRSKKTAAAKQYSHEKYLVDMLMEGYDNTVRPVKNSSSSVVIRLGITLTQIFDLDEKNQVLTTNVWLDQEWYDDFLRWDPEEYGNLTKIRVPCEKLWLPDIVLYNNADDYNRGYMNSRAMLEPDGNVFWPPPTKFRSTCQVDVTYFPFDDQTCSMKMGSWIYDGLQVDVTNRTSEVDLSNYVPNGEWELLDAKIIRNVVYYSCCQEPFPDVTVTIVIRRKTLYYMYNVVMPCMMMSILTLLVFCLPPESGEKIALGVTVLLAFSVFMLAIAEKMPETSESIPLLGIYLTAVMAITSISVVVTVVVLNFHYRGPSRKEVPPWLRELVLEKFSTCSCFRSKRPNASKKSQTNNHNYECCHVRESGLNNLKIDVTRAPSMDSKHEDLKDPIQESSNNDSCINMGSSNNRFSSKPLGTSTASVTENQSTTDNEILRTLRILLLKQEHDDYHNKVLNEWRQLALAVDRMLFWIFFVITFVSSLSFLVIVPFHRRGFFLRST